MIKLTLLLCCCYVPALNAFHLIGGDIFYECLGNDLYRFTMKIYRDCSNPRGDWFDTQAPVTIYLGNSPPYSRFTHLNVPLFTPITTIPPDASNPCLILPPNICVEEGVYQFDVVLPVSTMSYHIIYQRCCRNATINNIRNPDDIGATYSIELTPLAQQGCNNSPRFEFFPPTVICNNEPMMVNHSAFDPDGDFVVYEFCSPLKGGGSGGGRGTRPTDCNGFRPNPACPPPFYPVDYIVPTYTMQSPMGGNPIIRIDPITGMITGTPLLQGQYVVGVCAKEYRNGQLLSVVQRDFQFNVAKCDPTVAAKLKADEVKNGNQYFIKSCGNYELTLKNESFQRSSIKNFRWQMEINGQQRIYTDWDPKITFPGPGEYHGKLLLNPGEPCGDTAFVIINLYAPVEADFKYEYDTCRAGEVQFSDLSTVEGGAVNYWEWQFGDGSVSNAKNPRHLYKEPGSVPVTLLARDKNNCYHFFTKDIRYFPVPALIIVAPSDFVGCDPAPISFENLSYPVDETYRTHWEFGDGGASADFQPTHLFDSVGIFDVRLEITSPIGCTTDTVYRQLIEVQPSPKAAFIYSPEKVTILQKEVHFTNLSENCFRWEWYFPGNVYTRTRHPLHTFRDSGRQKVMLVVSHSEGCRDTMIQYLDIEPVTTFFLPNAFSPNDDSVNDFYLGKGLTDGMRDFRLSIWNRWGEKIFEADDPRTGWNGRKFNTGEPVPAGVFSVFADYTDVRGEKVRQEGVVTVIR